MSAAVVVHRPATTAAALALMRAQPAARWIGGGTELVPLSRDGVLALGPLVAVRALGLQHIGLQSGQLVIGAGATMAEVMQSALVQQRAPVLCQALQASASAQVRHLATVGGNLLQRTRCPYFRGGAPACNRRQPGSGCAVLTGEQRQAALFGTSEHCVATQASDLAVALLALDAEVKIAGPQGERLLPLEALYPESAEPGREHTLAAGELITRLQLPTPAAAHESFYLKLRDRAAFQFALVSLAVVVQHEGGVITRARLTAGGVGSRPWRLRASEDALAGRPNRPATWRHAATAAVQGARPLPGNAFKQDLLQRCVLEAGSRCGMNASGERA